MSDPAYIPVIVGVGEVMDRPATPDEGLEPLSLMRAALEAANIDAGGSFMSRIDDLAVVNQISWPYVAPAEQLAARLGLQNARSTYGAVGGETPLRFLQDAANAIVAGRSRVAAICGGEAHRTVAQAEKAGLILPWPTPTGEPARSIRGQDTADPFAKTLGLHVPMTVYALFENAQANLWGQTPQAALNETAAMWSSMSAVAVSNPSAWVRREYSPGQILAASADNRPIAFPYSKMVVANINVNQGAAILVTSLAAARSAGLDDGRLIFIHRSASAVEPSNYLAREGYGANRARDLVLEAARGWSPEGGYDAVELYSCFPCVPKAARRTLGLAEAADVTVAGGLSFFGAPLNNYMSHATGAMVRRLRASGGKGLLYGQGGFATKHHAMSLGALPEQADVDVDSDLNSEVVRAYGSIPAWSPQATGQAKIETHTVIHSRDGRGHGAIVARTAEGGRTLARVDAEDTAGLQVLEDLAISPIGRSGRLTLGEGPLTRWRFE